MMLFMCDVIAVHFSGNNVLGRALVDVCCGIGVQFHVKGVPRHDHLCDEGPCANCKHILRPPNLERQTGNRYFKILFLDCVDA